ncbi:DUF692 family multinuclear iron-containing protein [Candidatus Omnitrophota bacterium]
MIKIATPLSSLCQNDIDIKRIEYETDCWELRDKEFKYTLDKKIEIFHVDFQIIHPWEENKFEFIQKVAEQWVDLKLISFHAASVCDFPKVKNGLFVKRGQSFSRGAMIKQAQSNIGMLKKICRDSICFAVENNNFYPTSAYDIIADADFIDELVCGANVKFLFDIAHARISALNKGISYKSYCSKLPFSELIQIHFSGWGQKNGVAFDSHDMPSAEDYKELRQIISRFPFVKYCTVEYYNECEKLIEILKTIREVTCELS